MSFFSRTHIRVKQLLSVSLTRQFTYIVFICIVSLILSTKGIWDEGVISLNGDMARYMMNGVYFHDVIRDLPLNNPLQYTIHYFAKYPALSLGHHPLIPGMALAPFYAIFGISVFPARLMIAVFMLLMGIMWFLFIKNIYDENIAIISSLLLVTNLFIVELSRVVMSEIITLSLMITAFYFFYQYCKSDHKRYAWAFVFISVLSVYAKHTAVVMFPFCLGYFIFTKGIRDLFKKDIFLFMTIIILLILPLVPITLKFSQYNVAISKGMGVVIAKHSTQNFFGVFRYVCRHFIGILQYTWSTHFSSPFIIAGLISICIALYRRKKSELTFIAWIIFFLLFSVYLRAPTARHTIYWIPAFCLLAVTPINLMKHRLWKMSVSAALILIVGYQFVIAFRSTPEYARGYEEAAEYIVNNWKGDSVLYSANVDTGYFIFFVRKHDKNQKIIVLRADKILATSAMDRIIEDRIHSRKEIYDILERFGIAYIVLEDQHYNSPALELLREEVHSDRFVQRKRIPMYSKDQRLKDMALTIYEYKEYTKARNGAVLNMKIPLMGDFISVTFNDLLKESSQ